MSLDHEDNGQIFRQAEDILRKKAIDRIVIDAVVGAATQIMIAGGIETLSDPGNKPAIRQMISDVRKQELQRQGVLDADGNIIPGQEKFAAWGLELSVVE